MVDSTTAKIQLTGQGLMNHFGFFLILSSSQSIAISFDKKNLVGMMSLLASVTGVAIIIMNATFLVKYSPRNRIITNGIIQATGYTIIGLGCFSSFYVVMIGALIVGIGSAFGEVSHFGYLKMFPSEYIGPFVSGTGICGLTGSLMYLVLHAIEVPDWLIFFCLVPLAILYLLNFIILHRISMRNSYFNFQESKRLTIQADEDKMIEPIVSIFVELFLILNLSISIQFLIIDLQGKFFFVKF